MLSPLCSLGAVLGCLVAVGFPFLAVGWEVSTWAHGGMVLLVQEGPMCVVLFSPWRCLPDPRPPFGKPAVCAVLLGIARFYVHKYSGYSL